MTIDLRSDTVTKPTPGMRQAMSQAQVGDDVFVEDPTVKLLEEKVAEILGKEAALFMPSGTMANLIAVKAHTQPGQVVALEKISHIVTNEAAGLSMLTNTVPRLIPSRHGVFGVKELEKAINPQGSLLPEPALVCVENTHNKCGGRIWSLDALEEVASYCKQKRLACHMDGSRIWHAAAATGISEARYARHYDSVIVCFSKGLGAPVGSALAGDKAFIARSRKLRLFFGGAMRQVGILAAGALYGLENHRARLDRDHEHARMLAQTMADNKHLKVDPATVCTNIIICPVKDGTAPMWVAKMQEHGLLARAINDATLRMVTHGDVSRKQILEAQEILRLIDKEDV